MKHIKEYETKFKYDIGDYVYFLSKKVYGAEHEPFAKIVDKGLDSYKIEHFNNTGKFSINWLESDYFTRLLTEEEINYFKLKKSQSQYNL